MKMARIDPAITDPALARQALRRLREARDLLKLIGAHKALARTRLAISSCEGAVRHADLKPYRQERPDGQPRP